MPSAIESAALSQEWATLQNNHEHYEKGAQLIKLAAIALFVIGSIWIIDVVAASLVVILLWVQESIFRTSQARLGTRLLRIEHLLRTQGEDTAAAAFQLHSEWQAGRPGFSGLLAEYAANGLRPTVAFPYALVLLLQWALAAS